MTSVRFFFALLSTANPGSNRRRRLAALGLSLSVSFWTIICQAQMPIVPARSVRETQTPVFADFKLQAAMQEITHPQALANFRLHLEYRLPSPQAALTVRVQPAASVDLPAGKPDEWHVLDLHYEQLLGKPASVVAEVNGRPIANTSTLAGSPRTQQKEQTTFPDGIAGVPTQLALVVKGGAEIRAAWVQPLSDTAHAELIARADDETQKRGAQIYANFCAVCHGTSKQEGSMPTSRKFHQDVLTNGTDPFRMFQTVTKGYGQMTPLPLPVEDRYAAIQHLREAVLRRENRSQYFAVDAAYLAALPRPMRSVAKAASVDHSRFYLKMDFGPALQWTYQVAPGNIAYKGIAIRLDEGSGGVSQGNAWMLYDHDTMRVAAAWTGEGFIDWKGIGFDGSHGTHASIVGDIAWTNPVGPGWADPITGQWTDPRTPGRDGKRYGPLPRAWSQYRGLYLHNNRAIVAYAVGATEVLDSPGLAHVQGLRVFQRILNLTPSAQPLALRIAPTSPELTIELRGEGGSVAVQDGFSVLQLAPSTMPRALSIYMGKVEAAALRALAKSDTTSLDLGPLIRGGPTRWAQEVTTLAVLGKDEGPFVVDSLTLPDINPWQSFMRIGGFDFLPDGRRAALCTWNGDVWIVDGLGAKAASLTWQRITTGLFQPLGLKVVGDDIYITCRDQIAVLRDRNGDGETDFIECFNDDAQVTEHFHEFAMGLQADAAGNFYYAKSGCHALPAMVPQHGTLLRVSADGERTDILAHGFRAANGVCLNPDGTFFVTDQEGFWTPKNRINHVTADGGFFGNMLGYTDVTDTSDRAMHQPLCWITNAKDRSPAELIWVPRGVWGSLGGALLNTSYGYGRLYLVPHETIGTQMQGGVVELPIPDFPAGIMRGRFHPTEHQLYTAGLAVWASNCQTPGGFYRVRYNGRPTHLPILVQARPEGLALTFTEALDTGAGHDAARYHLKTWHLARTEKYGSKHLDEKLSTITQVRLLDARTVLIEVKDFAPAQSYELTYDLRSADGIPFKGNIHGTIHALGQR